MPVRRLTTEMLDELQALLREGGARLATSWRPQTRTREQIAEEMAGIGLGLPVELATWWAWHDGVEGESLLLAYRMVGAWEPLSVKDAVDGTRQTRELYANLEEPPVIWDPAWVMICFDGSRGQLLCDATVAEDRPSPVYCVFDDGWDGPSPAFPSLGELVSFWVTALRDGTARINELGYFETLAPKEKEALWGDLADLI